MKLVRFRYNERVLFGYLEGDKVRALEGKIGDFRETDITYNLDESELLAPVEPGKIVALGLNYTDHAEELGMEVPEVPVIFLKPPTAVIGYGEPIIYPKSSKRVDYEGELAIVISRVCKNVSEDNAGDYILGYTCANDVTARDLQKIDGQWTRAKSFDTFCPLGPFITDQVNPLNLGIRTYVNGKLVQDGNTSLMIFNVYYIVGFISSIMTLLPGDVILTGTPRGVGELEVGDTVEVAIDGIGSLVNEVVEE